MDRSAIEKRLDRAAWPIAVEQIETLALLMDSKTYGGSCVAYVETAISHIVYAGQTTIILRRPLVLNGERLLTPEERWVWCEDQAGRHRQQPNASPVRVLPIARRSGRLHLGGPGKVLDWVLVRSRPSGVGVSNMSKRARSSNAARRRFSRSGETAYQPQAQLA